MPVYRQRTFGGKLGVIDWASLYTVFQRQAENLLIKFGDRGDRITSLSGGNQQKVLIGRGFAMRPSIMILNDPARGIDVGAKAELYKHLRAFAESGGSVVYLSSEIEEFVGFASRVIVFRKGAPYNSFAGETLDANKVLAAMFGQNVSDTPDPVDGGARSDFAAEFAADAEHAI
jgi:ribose transport system ATP-binding protein